MNIISVILISIAESMDCFAVSTSLGLGRNQISYTKALLTATSFGIFQGLMTLLGYFSGSIARIWVHNWGNYLASFILCFLGIRFLWNVKKEPSNFKKEAHKSIKSREIILLSIATSLDAFSVGISFAFVEINLLFATLSISLFAFFFGILGFILGNIASKIFNSKLPEIFSSLILIGVGIKFLF